MSTTKAMTWPKARVYDQTIDAWVVMEVEEAAERYGIDVYKLYRLRFGEIVEVLVGDKIVTVHPYTADDAIRDAAPDLLAVCRELATYEAIIACTGVGDRLRAAIARAEGKGNG